MRLGWFYIGKIHHWRFCWVMRRWCGVFRNRSGIVDGRWGFYVMAFELGNRNPLQRKGIGWRLWRLLIRANA